MSEAYPPNTVNNSKYLAECHYFLKDYDISKLKPSDVVLRPIKYKKDITQLKLLHKEWFPVEYGEAFYEQVFKSKT